MPSPRNRRRRRGVPAVVTALAALLALMVGALGGYVIRDRLGPEALPRLLNAPADEDGLPVEPVDAAALLSGDAELAPLADPGDGGQSAEEEIGLSLGAPVVAAEYDGGVVLSDEVLDAYNETVNSYILENLYAAEDAPGLLEAVLRRVVDEHISLDKAEALGLTELDAADEAEIAAQAAAAFAARVQELLPAGEDGDAARLEAARRLEADEGVTEASIAAQLREDYWLQKLRAAVTADVELTDEALEADYQALLERQRQLFTDAPGEYDYARLNGERVLYNPEGYRVVRQILFAPDEAGQTRLAALLDERADLDPYGDAARVREIDAALAELYAPLEAEAAEAAEALAGGEDFDALVWTLSDDPDAVTDGGSLYVGPQTLRWGEAFTEAALALETPGSLSAPVRGPGGVHLILYVEDVPAGEVPLDDIRDEFAAEALAARRDAAWEAQLQAWEEELHVRLYPERLE